MAVVYIDDSRIDSDAPIDDIINSLMNTGWVISYGTAAKLSSGGVLKNNDITVSAQDGNIQIDLSKIVQSKKESEHCITVDGINVLGQYQFPTTKYAAFVDPTLYTCWNTTTGICFIVDNRPDAYILNIIRECNVAKLDLEFMYKGKKIRLHDIPPTGIGLKYNNGILSDDQLSLATCRDGRIDTACVRMSRDVSMSCINSKGEIDLRRLIATYMRAAYQDTDTLTISQANNDRVVLYLKDKVVTDIVLYGGRE